MVSSAGVPSWLKALVGRMRVDATDAHAIRAMEHGCFVAHGNHEPLLQAGGRYVQMWAMPQRSAGLAPTALA